MAKLTLDDGTELTLAQSDLLAHYVCCTACGQWMPVWLTALPPESQSAQSSTATEIPHVL